MRKATTEWLKQAEYDFETAQAMFQAGRYIYTFFMCHLAVEKVLKAAVVEQTGDIPPKTHNLIILLKTVQLDLPEEQLDHIASLNAMSVTTRYPEDLSKALENLSSDIANVFLNKTREVLQCLRQKLTP